MCNIEPHRDKSYNKGVKTLRNAPIAIFGFNRATHLRNCLDSLEKCDGFAKHYGYIFIDGPRNASEAQAVEETILVAQEFAKRNSFELIVRQVNFGLAKSVRYGIDHVFQNSNKIIVIEDDLILEKGFLSFINAGLDKYRDDFTVASISGYQYPIREKLQECAFLRGADCWGWGTWKNRWEEVNFNGKELLEEIYGLDQVDELNLNGSVDYEDMLIKYCRSEIDSWATPWHISNFLQNKLTLYPPFTYVSNEGGDGSGTHFGKNSLFSQDLKSQKSTVFPVQVLESEVFRKALIDFYNHTKKSGSRIRKIKRLLAKLYRLAKPNSPKHSH